MQKDLKVKGLVIRTVDVGDADRILTVLTGDYGRITVFGKGVRSIKSQRLNASQLFCYSDMVLTLRGDRYYLGETTKIEDFYDLRKDLVRLSLAGYIAESVGAMAVEGDDQSEILQLTLNTLYRLSSGSKDCDLIKGAFELRLAALLGFTPNLSGCSVCQKDGASMLMIPEEGALICADCLMKQTEDAGNTLPPVIPISDTILTAMRYVLSAPAKRIFAFDLPKEEAEAFSQAAEKYFLCHVERGFETLEFYKLMRN